MYNVTSRQPFRECGTMSWVSLYLIIVLSVIIDFFIHRQLKQMKNEGANFIFVKQSLNVYWMLVTIVGATDQRKKTVGVGQPLDMEALKVKGLFRQREPSLRITEERQKKKTGLKYTVYFMDICTANFVLFCYT